LIDNFLDLLEAHQEELDPLSVHLTKWGEELAQLLVSEKSLNPEQIASKLYEIRKIVINPLDGSPLDHPRLAGGRLWEEWMLEHVKELFENFSCYSDGACLSDVKPHIFAEKILRWRDQVLKLDHPKIVPIKDELERLLSKEDRSCWLDREESLRSRAHLAVAGYVALAKSVDECEFFRNLTKKVGRATHHFEAVSRAAEESKRAHIEAAKIFLVEEDKRVAEDLKEIQASYERVIQNLRDWIREVRRENIGLECRLLSAEERVSELSARVSELEVRVQVAEAQNETNWQAAHSGESGCNIM
jgi:hypothetical protein